MYYCKSDDLDIYAGSELTLLFHIVQADGQPIDITACDIYCRIQRERQDSAPLVDWEACTITDADDGYCTLDLETIDTSAWEDGDYKLQLRIESSTETNYTYPNVFYVRGKLEDAP